MKTKTKSKRKRLGIIQSRGLGDIFISLPIAHYYHLQEWDVYWPIQQEWCKEMTHTVPWIKWIPIERDQGPFFYEIPLQRLQNFGCDEILPLYNALTSNPEFSQEPYFQHTAFDEYKYHKAGVPFLHKWRLAECITRDRTREQTLFQQLVNNPNYVVIHTQGSDSNANFDRSIIPTDWQQIEIKGTEHYITDWLTILEQAQSLILVDSVFANIVDQMNIGDDRYFLPRSHIQLTPTLGNTWTWLENTNLNPKTRIFQPGK